jgi:phosphatidate cytidylyltransferase
MERRLKTFDLSILNTPEGKKRLISSLVLAPLVIALVCLGGSLYAALVMLVITAALWEWIRLVDPLSLVPDRYMLCAASLLVMMLMASHHPFFCLLSMALSGGALYLYRRSMIEDALTAQFFTLGIPYLAGSGVAMIYLRSTPSGLVTIIFLLATVWGMDIGAYGAGRLIGGAKMAPTISPNKTWAGFFGGLALAVFLAGLVLLIAGAHSFWTGLVIAAILGAIAQAGDLFKSFFKRRAGVKDCGNLIPGHGGVLDRIDGLVFAALALAVLTALFGSLIG